MGRHAGRRLEGYGSVPEAIAFRRQIVFPIESCRIALVANRPAWLLPYQAVLDQSHIVSIDRPAYAQCEAGRLLERSGRGGMEPTGRKDQLGVTCVECAHFICLSVQPTTDEFSVPCRSCRGRAWYPKSALRSQSREALTGSAASKINWAALLDEQLRKDLKTPYKTTTVLRYVTEKISAIALTIAGVRLLSSARLR